MAKKLTPADSICTCCGADITAPQFYKGKAYGWSCVVKVAGKGFKRKRDNGLWIPVDAGSVEFVDFPNSHAGTLSATVNGIKFSETAYRSLDNPDDIRGRSIMPSGWLRVSEFATGGNCLWTHVTVEVAHDAKGKAYPVRLLRYVRGRNEPTVIYEWVSA